jgi:tetratricopeptide (TPR) repeat protein
VDAAGLRRAYVGAIAARLHLTPGEITTTRGALAKALRRAGTTPETAAAAEALLVALDRAAYSPGAPPPAGAAASALDLFGRVDGEARSRLALAARRFAPSVALAVAVGAGAAGAASAVAAQLQADEPTPAERFAAGRAAYEARRFPEAARLFADVARAQPRAADAWANFGTSSWAAADTAAAVVGWQRALRLEPLADDARDRLALVGPSQQGAVASVPRVPLDAATLGALALWCGGWVLLLVAARRPRARAVLSGWGAGALAASLVLSVSARALAAGLAAHRLAVVEDRGPLRTLPALAADEGAALVPGDVARVEQRQGAWARVALDGEREGWVEWDRLVPLGE